MEWKEFRPLVQIQGTKNQKPFLEISCNNTVKKICCNNFLEIGCNKTNQESGRFHQGFEILVVSRQSNIRRSIDGVFLHMETSEYTKSGFARMTQKTKIKL